MQLISASLADIEDDIINYFSERFGDDPSVLPPATDVRKMYNFKPPAWAQLGDTLSALPWMRHLGVVLSAADMGTVATIEQIAYLIWKRIQHIVAAAAPATITPLTTLMKLNASPNNWRIKSVRTVAPIKKVKRVKKIK
jgi:hypothetical protein